MTRPRKPAHGGKRKGAGRKVTSERTARLVVRVEPGVLAAATEAVGGGKALAGVVRSHLRVLAAGVLGKAKRQSAAKEE